MIRLNPYDFDECIVILKYFSMKFQFLRTSVTVENLSRKRKSENILGDPRQEKMKNTKGFEDRVLNI